MRILGMSALFLIFFMIAGCLDKPGATSAIDSVEIGTVSPSMEVLYSLADGVQFANGATELGIQAAILDSKPVQCWYSRKVKSAPWVAIHKSWIPKEKLLAELKAAPRPEGWSPEQWNADLQQLTSEAFDKSLKSPNVEKSIHEDGGDQQRRLLLIISEFLIPAIHRLDSGRSACP